RAGGPPWDPTGPLVTRRRRRDASPAGPRRRGRRRPRGGPMSSPYQLAITGNLVIVGKEPDGDSVRFVPDKPASLRRLRRQHKIVPARDGSVQLRFEAVDAPETHYGTAAQPLGADARNQLLS